MYSMTGAGPTSSIGSSQNINPCWSILDRIGDRPDDAIQRTRLVAGPLTLGATARRASGMYCPQCGREMSQIDGVFTCVAGDMPLSRHMQAALCERFPELKPRPAGAQFGRDLAAWFCPGCGIPLALELRCPSCGRSLRDLFVELVELHPHRDERGQWLGGRA